MTAYKKLFLLAVITVLLLATSFRKKVCLEKHAEDRWSGLVTFHEKKTSPKIVRSDWWMIATITNNAGNALDSSIFENTDGDKARCATNEKTELELGIDENKKEYGITVRVPGCYGTITDRYGKTDSYGLTDETAIVIERQKLGTNPNVLSGQIKTIDGPDANGNTTITIYEWNLKQTK